MVPHLIEHHYDGDLIEAVRKTYRELAGHFAFVVVSPLHPDLIVGARLQCPLVLGIGDNESFVASDVVAFLAQTRRVKQIEDGELIALTPEGVTLYDVEGGELERPEMTVDWDEAAAEKGGYETFMLKEIHEQPEAMRETIGERIYGGRVRLELGGPTTSSCTASSASRSPPAAPRTTPGSSVATCSRSGRASRSISTWRPRRATAARSSTSRRSRSPCRSPARPPTRSPPSVSHAMAARACSRSRT